MQKPVNIPAIIPCASERLDRYVTSQPIIQLKELEVDQVRYDAWKANVKFKKKPKA